MINQPETTIVLGKIVQQCRDPSPAPFTYFVWQKGYFHPFPLIVDIVTLYIHI